MTRPLSRLLQARICHPLPRRTLTTLLPRHTTTPLHPRLPAIINSRRSLFIQTHSTPNPSALKFHPGTPLLPVGSQHHEFLSGRTSHNSPLARKIFALDNIQSLMVSPEFITITITDPSHWPSLKPEIFSLITEHLSSGQPVVLETDSQGPQDTAPHEDDSEVVAMVKELLDTRIRPAVQDDGGDIEFMGFDEDTGTVKVQLRGACRTCDSSTATLKMGIESMLMHYIEEVKCVEQVLGEEEIVSNAEFAKFEEKLKKVKGANVAAGGTAPIDRVEG